MNKYGIAITYCLYAIKSHYGHRIINDLQA